MDRSEPLLLVDRDTKRRAAISHGCAGSGIHVEPFEDISELALRWPGEGIILAHDHGTAIPEIVERMTEAASWLPLVAFDATPSPQRIVDAVLAGAVDYLAWPFAPAQLGTTLNSARERSDSFGSIRMREAMARSRIEKLTRREREVLVGVASGLSNRLIGDKLCISPRTVEIHRANMLNKMGANHTSEAICIAIEASLVN